jgi:hypothetical protein
VEAVSTTLHEVTIEHLSGRTEKVTCGWVYGPKEGVLHLHEIQTDDGRGDISRAVVLANVVGYEDRRLR